MTRWNLTKTGPYRVFFPLGILCALLGVGHWVLWSVGWIQDSSGFFHASMQIQGFLTCFVAGFLMTALPRFLGTFSAAPWEIAGCWGAECLFAVQALRFRWVSAEWCYLASLAVLMSFAIRRLPSRTQQKPSSFILIGFGIAQAALGTVLTLASGFGQLKPEWMLIGRQMLQIGFVLSLVLGVAGFLLPFLTGYTGDPAQEPRINPLRRTNAASLCFHALTGILILGSFFLEPQHGRWGALLRAGAASIHFLLFGQIYRRVRRHTVYAHFFYTACWMVLAGLWAVAAFPDHRLGGLHILFIGGFSLLVFSFGSVVVLTHAAQASLLNGPLIPLKILGVAVLLAMALRVVAELDAWRYRAWIHASSGLWVLAAAFWLVYVLPKLWVIPLQALPRYDS